MLAVGSVRVIGRVGLLLRWRLMWCRLVLIGLILLILRGILLRNRLLGF